MTKGFLRFMRRNTIALLALFLALGGTTYAASSALIARNSVASPQVVNGSLQTKDLSKKARKALKGNRGLRGLTGAPGAKGATGGLEGLTILPPEFAVVPKAFTAAYFSSAGNAFSTRTASQIIQSHFNPEESNQPGGPLFGVQFSQLTCSDLVRHPSDGTVGPKPA